MESSVFIFIRIHAMPNELINQIMKESCRWMNDEKGHWDCRRQ